MLKVLKLMLLLLQVFYFTLFVISKLNGHPLIGQIIKVMLCLEVSQVVVNSKSFFHCDNKKYFSTAVNSVLQDIIFDSKHWVEPV